MQPTINGKQIIDCNLEDLQILIDNPDYRENEFLDYKQDFSVDKIPKGKERQDAIEELRNDVCSFANAQGGYLIYGIKEDNCIPSEICGITLKENSDKFELNLKNYLQPIAPCSPRFEVKFISLQNDKYVVVLFVKHDQFAPYVHVIDNKIYAIYKRSGNSKQIISYVELKNMFVQSLSIDKGIVNFRNDRVEYFKLHRADLPQFLLLHVIPDTFLDSNYRELMYLKDMQRGMLFDLFSAFDCISCVPSLEGVRYLNSQNDAECRFFNNGIAECFYKSYNYNMAEWTGIKELDYNQLDVTDMWKRTSHVINQYAKIAKHYIKTNRVYICITIVGCENLVSGRGNYSHAKVDRQILMCEPVIIDNLIDQKIVERQIKQLHLEYYLSLGICNNDDFKQLAKELYD